MKNKSPFYKVFISIFVSLPLLILANCVPNSQGQNDSPSKTPYPSQAFEQFVTSTLTHFALPTLTNTNSPIPESTWTPLPTIPPENIDNFIETLAGKCELPCWGNITPEKTNEQEAKHLLSSFGTIIESTSIYFEYRRNPAVIDLTFRDGVVDSINLPPELTETYQLNSLLSRYGMPADVRIEVIPETAEGTSWFYLAVFYPKKGILALFSGEGKIVDSKVNACFEQTSPDLYLLAANTYSVEQMNTILDPYLRNMLEPLESLTQMDKQQFYDTFSQPTKQCLATAVQGP